MMPKIKDIYSSDVDNLKNYAPSNLESFNLALSLAIGLERDKGSEIFQVSLVSPKWLLDHCNKNDIIIGRHYIIVLKYNYLEIEKKLNDICTQCIGADWEECALKLSRYFSWEFEDYVENPA